MTLDYLEFLVMRGIYNFRSRVGREASRFALSLSVFSIAIGGCRRTNNTCDNVAQAEAPVYAGGAAQNVLVIVLDDIGVDRIGAFGVHPAPSVTPHMDALISSGVRFDRAYASPTCSPSRASMLTGRHPSRHGIGQWISPHEDTYSLPEGEYTFAEMAADAGWATAAVGKWHLSAYDGHNAAMDPLVQGFQQYHGVLGNPSDSFGPGERELGYWRWERIDNGELSFSDTYITTAQTDDALQMMRELASPWVVFLAFSAAHVPLETPPAHLAVPRSDDTVDRYDAVVQALDAEIGRMVEEMGELRASTTIMLIGDNGTPDHAVRSPWDTEASKGSLAEGGVRVPLLLLGPQVEPRTSQALVHVVDVFATIADLVGRDPATLPNSIDGVSLLPHLEEGNTGARQCLLVEQFHPDGPVKRQRLGRMVVESDAKIERHLHSPDKYLGVGSDPDYVGSEPSGEVRRRLRDEMKEYERSLD